MPQYIGFVIKIFASNSQTYEGNLTDLLSGRESKKNAFHPRNKKTPIKNDRRFRLRCWQKQ